MLRTSPHTHRLNNKREDEDQRSRIEVVETALLIVASSRNSCRQPRARGFPASAGLLAPLVPCRVCREKNGPLGANGDSTYSAVGNPRAGGWIPPHGASVCRRLGNQPVDVLRRKSAGDRRDHPYGVASPSARRVVASSTRSLMRACHSLPLASRHHTSSLLVGANS